MSPRTFLVVLMVMLSGCAATQFEEDLLADTRMTVNYLSQKMMDYGDQPGDRRILDRILTSLRDYLSSTSSSYRRLACTFPTTVQAKRIKSI